MRRACSTYDQTEGENLDTVADDVDHAVSLSLLPGWSDVVRHFYAGLADLVLATAELAHVRATSFDCATTRCVSYQGSWNGPRQDARDRQTHSAGT
eukprot:COSAG02_NODE_1774_length_10973_cov_18.317914_5_plen_96_part_00